MRRILIAALLALVTINLVGCGGGAQPAPKADPNGPKPPGEASGGAPPV